MPDPKYEIEVALTFDDGPDGVPPEQAGHSAKPYNTTGRVLDVLRANSVQNDIKAAFFVQTQAAGHMAEDYGKQLVKSAHEGGHIVGLQNGSRDERPDHPARAKAGLLKADLAGGRAALEGLLGADYHLRYVRGPFGLVNPDCLAAYAEAKVSYVFWHASAQDLTPEHSTSRIQQTLRAQVRRVADRVRKTGRPQGLVVELHDTSHLTAAYFEQFLRAIRDGGQPYRPASKRAPKAGTPVSVTFCQTREAVAAALDAIPKAKLSPRIPARGKLARLLHAYGAEEETLQAWDVIWFEDWVPYLYLDSRGRVTVGVGHLVADAKAAEDLDGLNKEVGETAKKDRSDAWKSIAKLKVAKGFNPARHKARYYEHLGTPELRMKDDAIEALMETDLDVHENALVKWLGPGCTAETTLYAECPLPARLALFDMMYNLGPKKIAKYKKLLRAVKGRDWAEAGRQCERQGPPPERNAYTKALFDAAAVLDPKPRRTRKVPRRAAGRRRTASLLINH